ncbi:MAG: GNAT family N-acetyltransferase [Clostridia bacterium]|nr:GNAT family N-acetyltransferase [Clostridia bacterium]
MVRQALKEEKEKVIKFYDVVIEANNKAEINLRWQKNIHPSHKLLNESVDNGELFIYEEKGDILGACIMNKSFNESYLQIEWGVDVQLCELGIIHVFGVHPECFRKGIGEKLLNGVKEYARKNKIKAIRLDVFKINTPAVKLYEKLGFLRMGEIVMFVPNIGDEDFYLYEYKTEV